MTEMHLFWGSEHKSPKYAHVDSPSYE